MAVSEYKALEPHIETLENGLTVILEYLPYVHSVSTGIWIKTGSANESPEVAGISHFLEHMFFKGTPTRTAKQIMEEIERRGGQMNAFTSREYTCLYARTLDRHVGIGIDVLSDILKNPTFDDLDKERNVILEEIATSIDTPDEHVHDVLSERIWPEHPLGRPIAGYHDTVTATGLEEVRTYKESWYRPGRMAVIVVGNFDVDAVLEQVREAFGPIPAGESPARADSPTFSYGVELTERDIAQNHIALGFPGTPITGDRRYCFDMLSSIYGGGSTSRLFDTIREKEGLAYAIYSYNSPYLSTGMLGVYAGVGHENLDRTVQLIFEEARKLQDATVPEDELNGNREQLKGGLLMALENTFNRMARMARSWMFFDRVIPVSEILDGVNAITADDVQELAQEILRPELCAAAILGPLPANGFELPS